MPQVVGIGGPNGAGKSTVLRAVFGLVPERHGRIDFDGRDVLYERKALENLTLGYAITVHKAQGSEYPAVVLPLTTQHAIMLQRNLLYTAITRGRRLVVVIGTEKAVALAVQNILGDLFASLSIVLDKPFVLGDFLIVDEHLGTVEYIGLKSTRLRSLWGEQIVFSNADLLKSRLRNFGRMFERRIVFPVGVTYQTPRDKLEAIPGIIREAIQAQEKTRFDRSHFKEFGDFSINFESVYYVLVPDYNLYMDIQQAINLQIHKRFEEEGIEFAYPTQTLFVVREGK